MQGGGGGEGWLHWVLCWVRVCLSISIHGRESFWLTGLADSDNIDDLFELRTWLNGVYDQIEHDQLIIDEVLSSQPNTDKEGQGRESLNKILDDLWNRHGSGSLPDHPGPEDGGRARVEKGLRDLADGRSGIPVRTSHLYEYKD